MKPKSNINSYIVSLTIISLVICSNIFISNKKTSIVDSNNKEIIQVNSSTWSYTNFTIYVNESDSNYNWAQTKLTYPWCSGNGLINDPYVIEDVVINAWDKDYCIQIIDSIAYFIIKNCTLFNATSYSKKAGIALFNSDNGKIVNNTCHDNYNGIYLDDFCYSTNISYNHCYDNKLGIYAYDLADNNYICGNLVTNSDDGIMALETGGSADNNIIINNTVINSDGMGISVVALFDMNGKHNRIINNTIINSTGYGIQCQGSYTNIINNTIKNTGYSGIDSRGGNCDHNIVINNTIKDSPHGIRFTGTNITLSGNIMENSGIYCHEDTSIQTADYKIDTSNLANGKPIYYYYNKTNLKNINFTNAGQIFLNGCNNSLIEGYNFSNVPMGLIISYCFNLSILNNHFTNTGYSSVRMAYTTNSRIYNCSFLNNWQGIELFSSSQNTFYCNNFTNSQLRHALNHYTNNWDNGSIGNSWDDYTGLDLNNDGIGDSTYSILGGGTDRYPIFRDLIAPVVSISSPSNNSEFENPPTIQLNIIDTHPINTTWYIFNESGIINIFSGSSIQLNSTLWQALSYGSFNVTFYANDTAGNIGYAIITLIKKEPSSTNGGTNDDPSEPTIPGYLPLLFLITAIL